MSGDTAITLVGNLTADPELRFTQSGVAVAGFTVASTPRVFDRASGEWKDGDALFLRCTLWRQPAENVAETLTKGARVIVTGRLKQRSYDTREGEKRTVDRGRRRGDRAVPAVRHRQGHPRRQDHHRAPPRPAVVNTAAATRGPAPAAGTTNPRSDQPHRQGGGTGPLPGPTTGRVPAGRPRDEVPRGAPAARVPATGRCPAGAARRAAGSRC